MKMQTKASGRPQGQKRPKLQGRIWGTHESPHTHPQNSEAHFLGACSRALPSCPSATSCELISVEGPVSLRPPHPPAGSAPNNMMTDSQDPDRDQSSVPVVLGLHYQSWLLSINLIKMSGVCNRVLVRDPILNSFSRYQWLFGRFGHSSCFMPHLWHPPHAHPYILDYEK